MALSNDRHTNMRQAALLSVPVAANAVIYAGALVAADEDGYAAPGTEASDLTYLGRAEAQVDNTGGEDGDINVQVRCDAAFKWENSAGDPVDQGCLWRICYIEDDQTVSKGNNSGARSAAGIVLDLDDDGVWVAPASAENAAELMAALGASHKVVAAGIHDWAGGAAATDTIDVAGILETDIVLCTLAAQSASETLELAAADEADEQIDLTLSANGADGTTKVSYAVLRA
jgi:hypothetical protein